MNVLITRPDQRGEELRAMLNEQHIFALHQPLFTIEAGNELLQLPSTLSRLNSGDYVFAVSKHAVDFATKTLKDTGFKFRQDLNYFAVGQHSAHYFCTKGEIAVHYPIVSENSEGLLSLPEMLDLQGKNLLILRAEKGRDLLAEQAVFRGANVQHLECYRRIMVDENLPEKISVAKRLGIDTIVATSVEILTTLYEQTDKSDLAWLVECQLVTVSLRIAHIARKLGWTKIIITEKADNQSLFESLLTLTSTQKEML